MKARRLGRGLTALAATMALGMTLLSAPAALAETPQKGGTLTVGFRGDSKTFNPIHSIQWTERQVLYLVYNTLLRMGPDFSINPELAERWDIENDGQRIVLHLRQGVKFHDGTDFDAAAVKWNLERRMDEAVGSPQRKQLVGVVESIDVVDSHTVAVNLVRPFAPFLALLVERPGFMVSPTALEK
ncbi:MAG: ABC transporter substrate-binding protein, partial [Acidobacteriota bacterium]